ncbi:hypothetical protein MM213_14900 [Belliella sp. R4-6]|uniref:Lipopolysaccharide assembly protein A domain-containing protein n=1 Tax=Belliella alkalica TaxID=1730871 RepID=A0ABS9VEC4_9BACT|nr:hypothetical protein [Belliella alkalica]MCH7414787.1 hypothetical protein [Belliella alkalica]
MKKFNNIMQLLLALFFAISLVYFLAFESTKGLFGVTELHSGTVVTFLLIGLILFLATWGTSSMVVKGVERDLAKKELEKNELKAKLYDLEQGVKLKNLEKKIEHAEEERENSGIRPRQNFK